MTADAAELDRLFAAHAAGDREAFSSLVSELYAELKRIARSQLRRGRPPALETTMLVHEAYVKLASGSGRAPRDREHFFAVCARAMRHLVVDQVRADRSDKRGGGEAPLQLDTAVHLVSDRSADIPAVNEALDRLERVNPRLVRLVELRVFAGCTENEVAELTCSPLRTVQRDWQRARAWLRVELEPDR
jgi:RNA polymerase sigma factor (TIGR02999 family)